MIYRQAYDINNLLGDLGGVVRVLLTIFGVLFYPINQYLFVINMAKKLYMARTKENDLFQNPQEHIGNCKIERKMMKLIDPQNMPCSYGKKLKLEV